MVVVKPQLGDDGSNLEVPGGAVEAAFLIGGDAGRGAGPDDRAGAARQRDAGDQPKDQRRGAAGPLPPFFAGDCDRGHGAV